MMKTIQIFTGLFLILVLYSCGSRQIQRPDLTMAKGNYLPAIEYISNIITQEMEQSHITGLSIALVDGDKTVWAQGFGLADKNKNLPVTTSTIFNAGSVSKLFTATAIMQLAEKGKIDLDKPIQTYLPEFAIKSHSENPKPITVRQLLTHHSGIPSDLLHGFFLGTNAQKDYDQEFLKLPGMYSNDYTTTQPDTIFAYCNTGFSLLGNIVARVSGTNYEAYVREHILRPLGMESSSFLISDRFTNAYSKGYDYSGKETGIPYIRDIPAGALNTTPSDLAKFIKMILSDGNGALKPETLKQMFTPQNTNIVFDGNFRIGLAYWLNTFPELNNEKSAFHGGDLPPYHTMLFTLPEKKLGVAVMVNSGPSSFGLARIVMESLKSAMEVKTGRAIIAETNESPVVKSAPDKTLNGLYAGPFGIVEIKTDGDQQKINLGGIWFDMLYHQDKQYSLQFKLLFIPLNIPALDALRFSFPVINGKTYGAVKMSGLSMGIADRIESKYIPDIWTNRLGTYEILNSDYTTANTTFELSLDNERGLLLLKAKTLGQEVKVPVRPFNDKELIVLGLGRGVGGTIRLDPSADGEVLYYSGYILKRRN